MSFAVLPAEGWSQRYHLPPLENEARWTQFERTEAKVVEVLERLAEIRGLPEVITVDNGPEFTGKTLDEWAYHRGIKLHTD